MEMWFMEAVPSLYGAEDSDELEEPLQEDGQARVIQEICAADNPDVMRDILGYWLGGGVPPDKKDDFVGQAVSRALRVQ